METITDKTINSITNEISLKDKTRYFKLEFTEPLTISQISDIIEALTDLDKELKFQVEWV